ncbi:hypothetical protein H4R35_004558 [Dimargaris xerosporica]|nr:hypothetical protein H4R35_004558 [Dimargaris xerosporica]
MALPSRRRRAPQASQPTLTSRQQQIKINLDLQRCYERLSFAWQEKLLDPVLESTLCQAAQYLNPGQYQEVIQERKTQDLCGYPLCSHPCQKVEGKYRINLRQRKVYDVSEMALFCSKLCRAASKFYEAQLSDEPLPIKVTLLPLTTRIHDLPTHPLGPSTNDIYGDYVRGLLDSLPNPYASLPPSATKASAPTPTQSPATIQPRQELLTNFEIKIMERSSTATEQVPDHSALTPQQMDDIFDQAFGPASSTAAAEADTRFTLSTTSAKTTKSQRSAPMVPTPSSKSVTMDPSNFDMIEGYKISYKARRKGQKQALTTMPKDIDLLVLPELAFTGALANGTADAEKLGEDAQNSPTIAWAQRHAKALGAYVVVGFPEVEIAEDGRPTYYNSACFVDRQGELVSVYRKHHLCGSDKLWASAGAGFNSFDVPELGRVGLAIGTDLHEGTKYPKPSLKNCELARYHQRAGTQLLICPTAWTREMNPVAGVTESEGEESESGSVMAPMTLAVRTTSKDGAAATVPLTSIAPNEKSPHKRSLERRFSSGIVETDYEYSPSATEFEAEPPSKDDDGNPSSHAATTNKVPADTNDDDAVDSSDEEEDDQFHFMYWMYCLQPLYSPVHALHPAFYAYQRRTAQGRIRPRTTIKPTGVMEYQNPTACHVIICNRVGGEAGHEYLGTSSIFTLQLPTASTDKCRRTVMGRSAAISGLFGNNVRSSTYTCFGNDEGCFTAMI